MKAIVAVTRLPDGQLGIGCNGTLPWTCKEDLKFFKKTTLGKNLIMGRKTFESLGNKPLPNRKMHYVLTNESLVSEHENVIYTNFTDFLNTIKSETTFDYFVIGGSQVYKLFENYIQTVYVSIIPNKKYVCDTYYNFPRNFEIVEHFEVSPEVKCVVYARSDKENNDTAYLNFLNNTFKRGKQREDRTGTGTVSHFGTQIQFDISDFRLPLLTTKFVSFRLIIEELLWFLKGETDVTKLQNKKCHIWDYNTSRPFLDSTGKEDYPENVLIEGYGTQIRNFNGFDQLKYIEDLLTTDPNSRRIMWNLWNGSKLDKMVLPPCHNQVQFYVEGSTLSCHMYQRSIDTFLGFPWNIASYTLFTFILCKRHNLKPGKLVISGGDTHIYLNHLEQVSEQLNTKDRPSPIVEIQDQIKDLDWKDIDSSLFELIGYLPQKTIKGKMS